MVWYWWRISERERERGYGRTYVRTLYFVVCRLVATDDNCSVWSWHIINSLLACCTTHSRLLQGETRAPLKNKSSLASLLVSRSVADKTTTSKKRRDDHKKGGEKRGYKQREEIHEPATGRAVVVNRTITLRTPAEQ